MRSVPSIRRLRLGRSAHNRINSARDAVEHIHPRTVTEVGADREYYECHQWHRQGRHRGIP